ncbi:hypothetical protein KC19_2G145100 [Ceratodon purpureus]|uniref:F-box domain-containing protein n=1 Tax=Ceratodon purpureus TaxID=3225 RepID=A0A8T0IVF8_CERPU|nr:hypothetical protein KC19_2G145100 [Ceratodon purpureus]
MAGPSLSSIHGVQQSNLPLDVMECVLSLLPLPVLCRMRTVCKEWNHIICSSSFHDSYEQTWKERGHGVCFLTKFNSLNPFHTKIDRSVRGTTCFLDLDERRWYLIKGSVDQGFDTRDMAMDDGLVAEICCPVPPKEGYNIGARIIWCIQMSDPILKMRWRLDPCPNENRLPYLVVVAADRGSRVFRIFVYDNSGFGKTRLWIYESSTNKWRCASQPPRKGYDSNYASSAVVFQQGLYAIFTETDSLERFLVLYDFEKDTWSMVLENLPAAQLVELVVSSGKLFMMFGRSASSTSSAMMLEMVEIQVSEKTSRIVFQIPASTLSHIFGAVLSHYNIFAITCLTLRLNSDSSCSSVVLFSRL